MRHEVVAYMIDQYLGQLDSDIVEACQSHRNMLGPTSLI